MTKILLFFPDLRIRIEPCPSRHLIKQRISWTSCCTLPVIPVCRHPMSCRQFTTIPRAIYESLRVGQCSSRWKRRRVFTKEAMPQSTCIKTRRMSSMTSIATSFVNLTEITDTKVISDISPAVCVHVEVLNVSHLCIASCLRCTS